MRGSALALLLVTSTLAVSTTSTAIEMEVCDGLDRNTTFVVPIERIPAFQARIRRYADERGYGYFQPQRASDSPLLSQSFHSRDWSWSILVQTAPDGSDASASFHDGTGCNDRLPPRRAALWRTFIADMAEAGYSATVEAPRFLKAE